MTTTLIILVITVALFIWGRVRADIVLMPLSKIFLSKKQSGKKKKQGKSLDDLRSSASVSLLKIFDIKIKAPDARFLASGALFLLW